MNSIEIPAKEIPVRSTCDVVVAGAGMAGIAAAVSAARSGLRTTLVEYFGGPGGIPTTGALCAINGQEWQGSPVVSGFLEEIETRCKNASDAPGRLLTFNNETLKKVLLEVLTEASVDTLFYTQVIDAIRTNNRITHLLTASKSGTEALQGALFVDATGDADLAAMAGCPFEKGRASDGLMQSASLVFHADGVDDSRVIDYFAMYEEWRKLPHDFPIDHIVVNKIPGRPGCYRFNMVHIMRFDGTSRDDLTRARFEGT